MASGSLVALDVDGTLTIGRHPPSRAVRLAVREAVERGDHVVLATGRSLRSVSRVIADLGLSQGYVVCSNGAVVVDLKTGLPVEVQRFAAGPVVEAVDRVLPGALFAVEVIGVGHQVSDEFPLGVLTGELTVAPLEKMIAEPVCRLTAWWPSRSPAQVVDQLGATRLPGADGSFDVGRPWMVAFAAGVSKRAALERLRVRLGVGAEATLAVGDGDNDIEMLRWAAHGVAMGQAPPLVRAAADAVTGTIMEDGLASALVAWSETRLF
ncbi:HAD family hydrolase [Fodinicola feengrottensis]|uniref:HAD family hydrolase n=1 Tax=Fodinicola feengrottensis TaxID=435914 RepID=A0ABP4RP77_9ACTN